MLRPYHHGSGVLRGDTDAGRLGNRRHGPLGSLRRPVRIVSLMGEGGVNVSRLDDYVLSDAALRVAGIVHCRRGLPISHLELFVTADCNLRCDYCFVRCKTRGRQMDLDVAARAVDLLLDLSGEKREVNVMFFGGEPTLQFETIRRVSEYALERTRARGKKCTFSMTSNGTLITEAMMQHFQQIGLRVLLSIDGDQSVHDKHRQRPDGGSSYAAVASRIPMIKSYQGWTGVKMTVMPDTVDRLSNGVKELHALGINQFLVGVASGVEWSQEALRCYVEEMRAVAHFTRELQKKGAPIRVSAFEGGRGSNRVRAIPVPKGCRAGRSTIAVSPDGYVYGCSKFVSVDGWQGLCRLGTLSEGLVNYAELAALLDTSDRRRIRCRGCALSYRCSGGCPVDNYEATGSIFDPPSSTCRIEAAEADLDDYWASLEANG